MKKGYSFIHKHTHSFPRIWLLIILIGLIVTFQSNALNYVRNGNLSTGLIKEYTDLAKKSSLVKAILAAPVFSSSSYTFSKDEDAVVGSAIGTVAATDSDGQDITYSFTAGNGDGKFAINATTGAITLVGTLDYSTTQTYTLTVQAADNGTTVESSTVEVTVNVNDVVPANAAPVFANATYTFSEAEDAAVGAAIGTVAATDAAGQAITYSITAGNEAAKFAIDGTTGAITLAGTLNHATAATYTLTITATDNGSPVAFSTSTVTVNVSEVAPANIAPIFANATYTFSKADDATVGAAVGTVSATDAAGQTIAYSITAGNEASKFAINASTGAITLAGTLNHATAASYTLTITATDNGTPVASSTATVTVNVTEVAPANVAPVFANATYTFSKADDETVGAAIGTVSATDAAGQTIAYSITAGNEAAKFAIDGTTGAITLAGTLNHSTAATYTLTITATDNGSPVASSTSTVTVNVTEVAPANVAPVFANATYTFSKADDTTVGAAVGTVSATDAAGQTITYSITGGNEAAKFAIDGTTGVITLAGTLNHATAATYTLTITATDNGSPVASSTATVTVNVTEVAPANVAPVFANATYTFSKADDATVGAAIGTVSATDAASQTIAYSITAGNEAGKFAINASTGAITLAATLNHATAASYTLTITATDNGTPVASSTATVTVNVTEVAPANVAPIFANATYTFSKAEDATVGAAVGTVSASDAAGQTIAYSITAGNEAGKFAIDASTGAITLAGTLNHATAASYTLTITATDNGTPVASSTATITVNVTEVAPANVAPVFANATYTFSKAETATVGSSIGTVAATDAAGQTVTYSITAGNTANKFAIDGATGAITLVGTLSHATAASYTLTITATDNGTPVASSTATVTVNVTEVAPVTGCPTYSTLPCDQIPVTLPFTLNFTGSEGGIVDKNNAGTGFTMVDPYSSARNASDGTPSNSAIIGYEPSKLTITDGKLGITTYRGLSYTTSNNQINTLGVGIPSASGRLVIETAIVNPYTGSGAEQGGVWAGLNDKYFVKLVVNNGKIELRKEVNDVSSGTSGVTNVDQRITTANPDFSNATLRLRMVVDLNNNILEGYYSTDGVNYLNVGAAYMANGYQPSLPIADLALSGKTIYTGIFASYRTGANPVTYNFDNFSVKQQDYPVIAAPYRINAGGISSRTVSGVVFNADDIYARTPGNVSNASYTLGGTNPVPELYYERRFGPALSYYLPIANGNYTVKLHMVENSFTAKSKRIFSVNAEGTTVISNLDLFVDGGNVGKVVVIKTFDTNVTDGVLNLDFTASVDNAVINAIEILPAAAANVAPIFANATYTFSKADDATVGAAIGTVSATDAVGQTVAYGITAGNEAGKFAINASTGAITLAGTLNHATAASYTLTITATDNGTPVASSTSTVTVNVTEVTPANVAPIFANATYTFSKAEDATVGAAVGTVSASDAAGQTIAYSITAGNEAGKFAIDASTGAITLAGTLNHATAASYTLTITATDNGTPVASSTATITVNVTEVAPANVAPVFANATYTFSKAETATVGSSIGTVAATDAAGQTVTYSITAGNTANKFAIDGATGAITLVGTLSHATAASYTLTITATDNGTPVASSTATVTVNVTEVAPVTGCPTYSTLPCDQIPVTLPFTLNFTGSEGGIVDKNNAGTGFTMVDPYSSARNASDGTPSNSAIIGYEPSKLTITDGKLGITTYRGLSYTTSNNQINTLGVGIPSASGRLVIETAIVNPYTGSGAEQGGVWAGLNDKYFVKLVVNNGKIELRKEVNDVSSGTSGVTNVDQRITTANPDFSNATLRLRMVVDLNNNILEGYYSTDGVNYLNVGAAYMANGYQPSLPIADLALSGKTIYTGIFASYRTGANPVTYNFDNFSVKQQDYPVIAAPYRINAGGISSRTVSGVVFNADDIYARTPGNVSNASYTLGGTNPVPELYYERRFGPALSYYLPIANGNYTVKLHMVENSFTAKSKRIFSVNAEGTTVISNLDLFVDGGNVGKVVVIKTFDTNVTDGVLNLDFTASVDNAVINAIEILPAAAANVAPIFANATYTFSKEENAAVGAAIGTVSATGAAGQTVAYGITAGNEAGKFAINATTGVITLAGTLNQATAATYTLTITATDNGTPVASSTSTVTVNVTTATNHAPIVAAPINNQFTTVGTAYSFAIPATTFTDSDGDAISLSVTLTDGSPLPAWLSYNTTTKTLSGSPSVAAVHSIKVTATDGQAIASTEFTITVTATNGAPVVVTAPEAQVLTTGQMFSFITGSFSDPDAGDAITYSATLANGDPLPAWLSFSSSTQTFSGTAPAEATSVSVKIIATDRALATADANFTITINAAPVVVACLPISTLTCEEINVTLPFLLNFDGTEGGILGSANSQTGFTMVDAPSGTRLGVDGAASSGVTGYEPSKLSVAGGRLNIVTNKGIGYLTNNNQLNSLGVGFVANGKLTVETTIVNPPSGTQNEQAGIWLGLNDKTFVKLVVNNNKIELRKELNDVSSTDATSSGLNNPDQRITDAISGINTKTVRLRMVVDLVTGKLEGFYSVDGITYINAGVRYTNASNPSAISITNMALAGKTVYSGITATHRNGSTPLTFAFDSFSVANETVSAKTLAFTPNALDFAAIQGQSVTEKSTSLAANQGTPVVTFTSTSASWLTLPTAGLGTINFTAANFSTTMAPGIYEATVTASAEGYEPATLLVNLTVSTPAVSQVIKVNFQDAATVPPTGWVEDHGQPFGLRVGTNQGSGLEYGWRKRTDGGLLDLSVGGTSNLGNGRKRTTPADITQATFMHMQADDITGTFNGTKSEGYWEVKVANGTYDVTVSAGDSDPSTPAESHTINVEGTTAFANFVSTGTAGKSTRFKAATVRVTVADGFITINADGGTNTKINSAIITPVDSNPYLVWSASEHSLVIEKGTSEVNKTFSLDLAHSTDAENLPITLTATYGAGAANWLIFNASHSGSEPNVTFDYTAAKNLAEGTYSVTVEASAEGYTTASTLIHITVLGQGVNQPYVISSIPANGATNVSVNLSSIAANDLFVPAVEGFKGGVDNATLTVHTVKLFKVVGSVTTVIQGVVQGTGGGDAISFTPAFSLEANTKYKFTISNQVKSYSGAAFLPYEINFTTGNTTTGTPNPVAAAFFPKVVIPGTVGKKYTSLTFGPDGKFYALRLDGVIERFIVDHETGMLSGVVEIKTMTNKYGLRSSVGLTFDPSSTATNLIAWISHCSSGLTNAPEFDGNISKLSGADLENEQLVLTKLPRSKADHLVNSIAFGPDGALYYNQGSQSSMGIYDGTWQREEALLAATVMRLDLNKLTGLTLPLDARTTANQAVINAAPTDNMRMSDGTYNPYASTSPLTIFASGVRNAFDLVWHSNGQLYVAANGSAAGGNSPESVAGTRRPDGTFYSGPFVPTTTSIQVQNDWLFRINPAKPVGYYGHPNPLRGEYVANRGFLDNPKYDTIQGPDSRYRVAAFNFETNKSPNGSLEYKSNAFGGALKGRLLVCRFSGGSDIIVLEPGSMVPVPSANTVDGNDKVYDIIGAQTGSGTEGITGLSGFTNPLDITEDVQTGNLYVIEYNWNNISGKTAQIVLLKTNESTVQAGIATVSPSEIIDNDVIGGAAGANHTITIANTGNSALTVTSIALDGVDKAQFQLIGAPAPSVASPVTIAKGSAITFNLVFNPTTVGVKKANLLITSTNNPVQTVSLSGLGTSGLSGTNEPSLQMVLNVHNVNVNVGDDNINTNVIHSTTPKAALLGEEISVQAFERGEDGPVIIEPLSVFGPQGPNGVVTGFGWYTSGQPNAKNELFSVANENYQTVNLPLDGAIQFDPAEGSFGFYSHWPFFSDRHVYSEDALNTFTDAVPHHVRVYPLKNSEGAVIEHSYVVAMEETTSNLDYQDVVFIVRNVKPYLPPAPQALAFAPATLSFAHLLGTTTAPKTAVLTANSGTPALSISKSANSDWLVLPEANLGSISFGINQQGLAVGTYSSTVTVSADGYTSATLTVSLTVTAPVSDAVIAVTNNELIFDATKNTTVTKRITVTNTGTTTLELGDLVINGDNANNFSVSLLALEGEATGTSLAPEETRSLQIGFTPGNSVSTFAANLVINSNAKNAPVYNVGIYAMSVNGYEGSNEPPLQKVVNTLGYKINVGWVTLADGTQATMKGEEVPVQMFEKAGDGPVTITPVARYSPNQELPFGFYTKNGSTPVRNAVGTLSGVFGQHNTLFPQMVGGTDHFDPAAADFGIYVIGLESRMSYTENVLNAGGPTLHAVRTYPLKDRQGVLVPNSYLVCFEDASNGDYQDYMFVLRNVIAAGTRKALAFDVNTIDFSAQVGGTVSAKSAILTAENGTPGAITFSKSNVGWLTTPTPALGNLSFGVNTSGLPVGSYTTNVTAEAAGFASATITINLHITEISANAIKVNFQLSTSTTPAGYLPDAGLAYDDTRGYGWVVPATKAPKDHTLSMRERTSATADPRVKGFAIMQGTTGGQTPGTWEMKVDNGIYNVTIGAGDLGFYDSNHKINAEGVAVINGFVPTSTVPNQIATATVQVTDGKLTIDANGGVNSKIDFVIAEPATTSGDFTPPVASIQLSGTLQSSGTYTNQVIATVNASDVGGSQLSQVLYSLNNGPFLQYFSPVLVNAAGSYSIRAKAVDGNNNQFTTSSVSFTVAQSAASGANMIVENLDKFPSNDRLVFSRIQIPWRRTIDDTTFTPYNRNHDLVKVKISNKGTNGLNISALNLTNPTGWKIATINNVVFDPATTTAMSVAPGTSVEVGIQFIAQLTGRIKILKDTLNIVSNDDLAPKKGIVLSGLWQSEGEGGSEPHPVEILTAFGFKTNVGFDRNDGTNAGNSLILDSDEIMSSFFARADASKPVTVVQMAAYHGCCAATETFQYYTKGSSSAPALFTHNPLDGQSLLPLRNGVSTDIAGGSFNPAGIFGLKMGSSNSDRTKNSEGKIGIRVWKAIDQNGGIIPNTYIIGHDYIGNPAVTNYDYQDNMYFISNIKPESGVLNYSELSAVTSAVDFGTKQIGATGTSTISLKNQGQVYTDGSMDPAITIKSVEITGPNQNEFSVASPASSILAAQGTTTVNVSFKPNSQGLKNAALIVKYDNNLSPLRIPLYGISDNGCSVITLVKRIKGGADAAVTINGKVWEADGAYRQGSVKLDKPAVTPIAATDDDVLYQSYLSANADLAETRYLVPNLPNGIYTVRMHFVENFFTVEGGRVFSVNIENQTMLSNLDIFREVGYKAALVKDFTVSITDGKLDVKWNPTVNRLALAGMEIYNTVSNASSLALRQETVLGSECSATNGYITFGVDNSSATSFLYKMGANGAYQSSPLFSDLASGDYTFYVKENMTGGCETSKSFNIPVRNTLAFTVTSPLLACADASGTATVSNITGGSANQTITWNTIPAQTGFTATGLIPGTYSVTVLDASGCSLTQQVVVSRDPSCPATSVRINAGGNAFAASGGRQFMADAFFGGTAGTSSLAATDILNTTDDELYLTERSSDSFTYSIPVQNGSFNVILHFAEIYYGAPGKGAGGVGKRKFNVDLEGTRILTNYDIYQKTGGAIRAVQETFPVTITDGVVNLNFTVGTANKPKISAIEIVPVINEAPVLATIGNKTATVNQALTFTATATDAAGQTKNFTLVNAPVGATINATTGVFSWTPTAVGTATFSVKVSDNGTPALSDEEQITVTVNASNQAPVLAAIGNKTANVGQAFTFTATATDDANQTKTFSLTGAPAGTAINGTTGVFTWTPTAAGTFTFTVKVTDNGSPALSSEEQISVTVSTVVAAMPLRINAGGEAFLASDNRQFIADAYFGGTAGTSSLATTDILNTTDDVLYLTERSSTAFNYTIPVTNGSYTVILHFAEIYYGAPGKVAGANGKRRFNVDIEGARKLTNYDIYQKTGGAVRATQETFPITVTDGVMNIAFTSGSANKPKISAIEILSTAPEVNVAPVLATIGNKAATVGQALTFTASATDANATQTKTYSLVSAPATATINATTGVFSWTPTAAGTFTFTVKVTDNGSPVMSAEEQITVTVSNAVVNQAPVLAVIGNKTATVGQALTFTATATDPDAGQTKTYSLVNAPAASAINATTGVFSWTPTAAGTFTLTVKVTDNGSPVQTDEELISIVVSNVVANSPIRINAGGGAFTAVDGRQFIADAYFGGTAGTSSITDVDILNTTDDALYMTERSSDAFNYTIPVTNGSYNVVLHFAEIWYGAPGKGPAGVGRRKFNVDIEGARKITNYDIYQKTGGAIRATTESFTVNVTDGVMNIDFLTGTANKPKISAIEVIPVSGGRISVDEEVVEIAKPVTTVEYVKSRLYPNPVQKRFTVEISNKHSDNVSLQLISEVGRTYKVNLPENVQAGSKVEADISNLSLPTGVYLMKVQSRSLSEIIRMLVVE